MSDDEPVNPKPEIEEKCRPACVKHWIAYEVRGRLGRERAWGWAVKELSGSKQHRRCRLGARGLAGAECFRACVAQPHLQACAERIKSDTTREAHCTGQVRQGGTRRAGGAEPRGCAVLSTLTGVSAMSD